MVMTVPLLKPVRLSSLSRGERERLLRRSGLALEEVRGRVLEIISRVRERGDMEIVEFYEKFYGRRVVTKERIRVWEEEFTGAYEKVPGRVVEALEEAKRNIEAFHRWQLPEKVRLVRIAEGVYAGQVWRPLEVVGVYVPGGRAAYPSTALMTVVPARVAGVPRVVVCTPPGPHGGVNPVTLVALDIAGVREVYRVGGAHAAAAMAYGTETVPRVEKIVGPGGVWFTAAKLLLYGVVDVDFAAGPSEILVIADDSANPRHVALDMASQAEHDPHAAAVLVTPSEQLAWRVAEELDKLVEESPRREVVAEALKRYGAILLVDSLEEAFKFANEYAPEHLEVIVHGLSLLEVLEKVENAGSVFIGDTTPVALGDYVIGTNHVLPTGGQARRRGGLSVLDYIKIIDFQYVTPEGFRRLAPHAATLAEAEGLPGHARALEERLGSLGEVDAAQ